MAKKFPKPKATDTPHKSGHQQSGLFSTRTPNLKVKRRDLRFKMTRKYILAPPTSFMKRFMPPVHEKRGKRFSGIFANVPVVKGKEKNMYDPVVSPRPLDGWGRAVLTMSIDQRHERRGILSCRFQVRLYAIQV